MNRKSLGQEGELIAERFLKSKGYKIIDRNFNTRWGELDIVAQQGAEIAFVEVRTRTSADFMKPEESVNFTKQEHLKKAAQMWLAKHHPVEPPPCRFDVISVLIEADKKPEIEHFRDAFQ
jgi:putative endonuclease